MVACKIYIHFLILILCVLFSKTNTAPTTTTTTTTTTVTTEGTVDAESTTKSLQESDLIQLQTDAIKKILSTSVQSSIPNQISHNKPKCEDIESELKESYKKQTGQDIQFQEYQLSENAPAEKHVDVEHQRGDSIIIQTPTGRNLFNYYRQNDETTIQSTTPSSTTAAAANYNYSESENVILIPCIKQIGNRRFDQDVIQNHDNNEEGVVGAEHSDHQVEYQTESMQNQNSYVLQKVYSPSGYFLYYMYRLQNSNPYPMEQQAPPTSAATTTTIATTTTTATPAPFAQEPVYAEQLKFVIQMPYAEPEQLHAQNVKFDQYAYYPPDMQPAYVNAPQAYRPAYHMIRTLVIPNEYLNSYSGSEQQNSNTK